MQDGDASTHFLPAQRFHKDRILEIAAEIAQTPSAASLALVPLAVTILNETRQIVYANERFLALISAPSFEHMAGQRLGEALGCLHAEKSSGGCGTTMFCRYCGAANAIVKSLGGEKATQECSITRQSQASLSALNLQVWTSPLHLEKYTLVLNSMLDIAHEKILRNFERIFFHDIMNAMTGIKGIYDLFTLDLESTHHQELALLSQAIENIQDIIQTHKDFLDVETLEYQQVISQIESRPFLDDLARYCQAFNAAGGKVLAIDPQAADLSFRSDARIIQRILVNMVKNALEASKAGEVVLLGCEAKESGAVTFWVQNPAVMPEEVRLRVFERAFSTKGAGRGFGTYGMRLFARQCLGGRVSFESEPGRGTTFFLELPASCCAP